jgi:hypothetical protein
MKKIWINDYNVVRTPGSFKDYHTQLYGVGYCPVDRFDLLKHIDPQPAELQFKNIVPEPKYDLKNISHNWQDRFFATADQVADKIYQQAKNKTIVVMWSGGFDSTVALVSLMRSHYYKEFLDSGRLKVGMSSSSILEYPEMFYNRILNTIPIVVADHNTLMCDPTVLMVTGEGGDYLIGNTDTPIFDYLGTTNNLMANTSELWKYLNRAEPTKKFSYFLKELCKYAPFDIVSLNQAYWWLGQCFTHQGEMCLAYVWSKTTDLSELGTFNKIYRFFLDDLWNTFCFEYMSTNPVYTNFDSVRSFHKEYIINYTGDQNYYNKRKLYSQRYLLRMYYKNVIYEDYSWSSTGKKILS